MDRALRQGAARLGWAAIVVLGYEAGAWLRIGVTTDVAAMVKQMQTMHPETVAPRHVVFAADRLLAERVVRQALELARGRNQLLKGSCVAMSVGAAAATIAAAAGMARVELHSEAEWRAAARRAAECG